MTTRENRTITKKIATTLGASALAVGWLASHALAEGGPTTPATLYYEGEIVRTDMTPVDPMLDVDVLLFDAAVAGTVLCSVTRTGVPVERGHFRVPLDESDRSCADALHAHGDVWIELHIGSSGGTRETLPRERIGAVPYALEADHAVEASHAARVDAPSVCGYLLAPGSSQGTSGAIRDAWGPSTQRGVGVARDRCRTIAGCDASTAHMCTMEEAVGAAQSALLPPIPGTSGYAWVQGLAQTDFTDSSGTHYSVQDCQGWTIGTRTPYGVALLAGSIVDRNGRATIDPCESVHPVACCD